MFSSEDTSEGQLLIDVDDFIEGGKEPHRKAIKGFYAKYRFGKAIDLQSVGQEGTLFAGRRVVQHRDFRVTVSMDEYVKARLPSTEVPKEYLSIQRKLVRGCSRTSRESMGALVGRRPDMAATHSIIPSWYDRKSPQFISEVNAAEKLCHAFPVTITIWPLPFAELRWTTSADSSFDTGERQRHQQGWLVCATNKYFNQARTAPVRVLH